MATLIDKDFLARLNALNDKFAAGVPDMLARLARARAGFDPAAPNPAAVKELHETLHTIAGSAATFGFRTFGQQARNLEQKLRVLMVLENVGDPDWQRWLAGFDHFVDWAARDARAADYPDGPSY